MTSPAEFSNGPPEFPGLIDASDYRIIFKADFGVYEEIPRQHLTTGRTDIVTVSSYYQMPESFVANAIIAE